MSIWSDTNSSLTIDRTQNSSIWWRAVWPLHIPLWRFSLHGGICLSTMAQLKVCATCGAGATEKLLASLKDEPDKPVSNRPKPPVRLSKKEKSRRAAASLIRRYK